MLPYLKSKSFQSRATRPGLARMEDPMMERLPFLGGRPIVELEERKLASCAEVLRRQFGWFGNRNGAIRAPKTVTCSLDSKAVAMCFQPGKCQDQGKPCFMFEVKKLSVAAGLPLVSDFVLLSRLEKMHNSHRSTIKNMDKMTDEQEEAKVSELEQTFNIFAENWREMIENDDVLNMEEKEEKIEVLEDYLEEHGTR